MAKTQNETLIRRAVAGELRRAGWFVFYNMQSFGSYKGVADLTAMRDGKVVFVECKTETGKQSPDQVQFQRDCETHGVEYYLARGPEDVRPLLNSVPLF